MYSQSTGYQRVYVGDYIKTYTKIWNTYVGEYNKLYQGTYTKDFGKSWADQGQAEVELTYSNLVLDYV